MTENTNMPFVYILIFILSMIPVALIVMLIFRIRKLREILNTLAIQRNGNATKGNIFFYPVLTFYHGNNKIEVYSRSGQIRSRHYASPPYTYVKVKLANPIEQDFRVFKQDMVLKIGKILGMQDITIGADHFDEEVIIKATDESFIKNILTTSIQDRLLTIIEKYKAHVYLYKNTLSIDVPDIIYKEEEYNDLIDTTIQIVKKITGEEF